MICQRIDDFLGDVLRPREAVARLTAFTPAARARTMRCNGFGNQIKEIVQADPLSRLSYPQRHDRVQPQDRVQILIDAHEQLGKPHLTRAS